jgi:hypothetical protein
VNNTCQWKNMVILMIERTLKIWYLAMLSHYNILISYRTTHSTDNILQSSVPHFCVTYHNNPLKYSNIPL